MQKSAEVVIIGGGIMGASTAYHLARAGCREVVLLEKQQLCGMGATGQNAGGIRHQFSTAVNIELSLRSIEMLKGFSQEMGQEIDLHFCGYLFLVDNQADLEDFARSAALQQKMGVDTKILDPAEIRKLTPLVDLHGIVGGSFHDQDGLADPSGVLQGYLAQARRLGVKVETETAAVGLRTAAGRVEAIETSRGTIATPRVVLAAGPWSGEVARSCGFELPIEAVRRQIAVTAPLAEIDRSFPFVIDFSRSLYFHYEGGGILTGMSNPAQAPGFDISIDEEWRAVHLENAIRRLPLLENARLIAEWAGLYEVTPDHQPIIGRLPHFGGLYACTGFSGHGFMHGPVAGLLMAEEMVQGKASSVDIDDLRYDRFRGRKTPSEKNVV